jgi:hypothetical protein
MPLRGATGILYQISHKLVKNMESKVEIYLHPEVHYDSQ